MQKSLLDRLREYLETVAVWTFMLTLGVIFIFAAAVSLTLVWFYVEFQ
jgi:hypothetical protein